MRRQAWAWLSAGLVASCAGSPAPTAQRLFKDGVRQRALTDAEAEHILRQNAPHYAICYRREMMNFSTELSSYVFRVAIPNDGSGADVEMEKATVKGQVTLRECLEEAIERVRFPAHTGRSITLRVPVKGPA